MSINPVHRKIESFPSRSFFYTLMIILMGGMLFFAGCASQKCDCTDLNKRYTPPKHIRHAQKY